MKKIVFDNFEEMAIVISNEFDDIYSTNGFSTIGVVGDYDYINNILVELVKIDVPIFSLEMINPEYNSYDGGFVLTIHEDGIDIEKLDNIKLFIDSELFIHHELLDYTIKNIEIESDLPCYSYGFSFEKNESSNNIESNKDDDIHGFTFNITEDGSYKHYSFYTTDNIDLDSIKSFIEKNLFIK